MNSDYIIRVIYIHGPFDPHAYRYARIIIYIANAMQCASIQ